MSGGSHGLLRKESSQSPRYFGIKLVDDVYVSEYSNEHQLRGFGKGWFSIEGCHENAEHIKRSY